MRSPWPQSRQALTLLEVLLTGLVVICVAFVVLSCFSHRMARARPISCASNLKEVGLAFRIFAADHQGKFPMAVSATNEGSLELLTDSPEAWRQFQVLSNELGTAKFLHCPQDLQRPPANCFYVRPGFTNAVLTNAVLFAGNQYLSYFLATDASADRPQSVLAGDRNLSTNGFVVSPGQLVINQNVVLGYSREIHNESGHILLADGSVRQASGPQLNTWATARIKSGITTNIWLVP